MAYSFNAVNLSKPCPLAESSCSVTRIDEM